jgi:hypothetical protein
VRVQITEVEAKQDGENDEQDAQSAGVYPQKSVEVDKIGIKPGGKEIAGSNQEAFRNEKCEYA